MAKDEYVPFTGKLDAAPQFEPFDGTLDGEKPDGPLARGWNKAKQSMSVTSQLATGNAAGAAQTIKQADEYARANPGMQEGKELGAAWERGDGISGGISEVAGEFAKDWREAPGVIKGLRATGRNLRALGEGVVEQVPNMVAPVTGMVAGGAAGSAAAGPVGTVLGGWAGASAGNTLVEGGGMTQAALQKAGINPQDTAAVEKYLTEHGDTILGQSATKGAIIGAVDTATAGLGHFLLSGPGKAAASRALADMGVDAADKAAVRAAKSSAAFKNRIASDAAYQATQQGANKIARNAGAAALEPAGEFAGEFVGQGVATGEWDTKNAALEAFSSIGQSGAMFAGQKAYQALTQPAPADADAANAMTTSPGAADPNAPVPPGAAPVEAPDLQTAVPTVAEEAQSAQPETAEPTPVTPEQRIAQLEEKLAFVQQQAQANGWDQRLIGARDEATAELDALRIKPVDIGALDIKLGRTEAPIAGQLYAPGDTTNPLTGERIPDQRPLSQQMGLVPAANTPLTKAAALSVDTGASPVQFLGATGRDMQLRQTGPGVTDESNIIDVDAREVPDQRGIPTARRLTNDQEGGARAAPSQTLTLPAPTNLREGLERIRAQRQEAARLAQVPPTQGANLVPQAPQAIKASPQPAQAAAARAGQAAPVAAPNTGEAQAQTGIRRGSQSPTNQTPQESAKYDRWMQVIDSIEDGAVYTDPISGDTYTARVTEQGIDKRGKQRGKSVSLLDGNGVPAFDLASNGEAGKDAGYFGASIEGLNGPAWTFETKGNAERDGKAQPVGAQAAPAGGANAAGGSGVQAAGLTNAAPTENTGAQAAPAPGAQAAAPAEPEFTTIKTVYGDSVTVRTADLNGNKQRLRQYTKDGKTKAVPAIHRDNLDLTGDRQKTSAKENADNPFFNVITTKDGSTFASQAAASRELNRLAMGETHEVVAASEVQDGAQGFVIRRKPADAMAGRAETGGQQPAAPAAAELTLDEQLKQVNDQLANQGQVKNANTRAKRDQVRTAIAERDFPAILKAVDGDIDSAEAINQALQYAGDEPKAKVIERVLKNRGITAEYRQRWAERLMGEEGANNAVPAPPPGVVNVPPAIAAALDADMQAQKARITRLRNAATADGMSLDEKKQAQTQLKGAEFTLQTMRRTRFDAEDAAIKAIEQNDMAPFAEHITFFKTEKALQEMIGAAHAPAAKPVPKKKPSADKTRAKADLMAALADLGDILGKNTRMNIMPEQEQKLLPVLTRVLDAAFRLGYHKFKDSAKFALDQIRAHLGDEAADALTLDHLQGAYIAMAGGKEGVDTKRAVIDVETKAEIEAHTVVDPDAETDATIKPTMATADGRRAIAQTVADHMIGGNKFATINDARKFIEGITDSRIPPGTKQAKLADETVEVGVAIAARDIVSSGRKAGRTDEQIFNRLVSLYEAQPSLNVRDTDSLREQAYSTPAPLAFVASRLAKVSTTDKVGEPTGGNGMLLMEVAQQNAVVNELNDDRAGNLRAAGFEVTQNNAATSALAPAKSLDALVMNPPFGAVRDESGSTVTYTILPEYSTGEIDHAIVFKSLESMKDDGNAVLIIGGTLAESEQGRKEAYRGRAKRQFFFNLQQQYNVVDHFTVGGDLYKKQGTTYPVDVIVIRGRGQSARALPAADLPPIITTWAQLQEKLNGNNDGMGASRPGITGSNPSANGNSPEQSTVLEPAGRPTQTDGPGVQSGGTVGSVRTDGAGQPDGSVSGRKPGSTNDVVGQPGSEAQTDRPGRSGGVPGTSAAQQQAGTDGAGQRDATGVGNGTGSADVRARLSEEDAGKLQVKYQSFSGNKSVNTLVATNHLSALENAFDNLRKRVGNIDDYVRNSLQYSPEGFKKAFSAEQVEALALAIDNIERGRGFIIGDQTGIGKGRVVAAMIRYAKLNGKTPVFVTQMPDLYGDMMRDLNDIGMTDFKPLMTNNNAEVPLDADALAWFGEIQAINTRVKELETAIEEILMGDGVTNAGTKEIKTSVNPEVVSLRDEIAELKASKPPRRGKFLETPSIERHEADLAEFVKRGNIGDYGAIFTTYNQMAALDSGKPRRDKNGVKIDAAPPKFAYRNEFLQSMVDGNAMLILDESHNAGSAGDGKFPKVGDVVRLLVKKAGSVFYSSATFAKNPSVMDVYSKTDLGQAFNSAAQLSAALSLVPQQQVASAMLVENGQYIRRERSFDGIEYKIEEVEADTQAAEDVSTAMRLVVEFDEAKKAAVTALKDEMDAIGATIAAAGGGGSMGSVESTNFTSVMHNVINTFLLSLKADAAADVAIAAIKAGEKPVLTVANTMEMFIRDYAESAGLSAGDRLNATFGDVLMRYLEKTRKVRITGPNGDAQTTILSDQELGPDGVAAYESAREFIASLNLNIPLSPIDHIKERIADAGYSIGEVTGRQSVVERGIIRPRNKAEMNTAGKKNTIAKFNGGQLDALIINRSGSTGLSMHASETFPDQRRRVMVVAQAELDINNHMQMLGRTNRTGQVTANGKSPAQNAIYGLPRYVQLTANVPIELRPAAVLAAKMASLSANTTAGRKSAVEDSSAPDFMNKYGDEVAALVVGNDPDLNKRLGNPISIDDTTGIPVTLNAISKVTGRIGLLPLREQKAIYDRITNEYRDLIAQLDALGKNDLEAKTYALDAKTLESTEVIAGDGDSVFNAPVIAEKVDVKKLGKPYSSEKVRQLVAESLGGLTPAQHRNQLMEMFRKEANAEVDAARLKAAGDKNGPAAIQQRMDTLNAAFTRFRSIVPTLGSPVVIKTSSNGNIYGIPISIQRKKGSQSVGALSAWVVKYAVVDGSRVMGFPLSQVFSTDNGKLTDSSVVVEPATVMNLPNEERTGFVEVPVLEAFDRGQTDSREVRYVMTGNLLRAGGKFSGRLISYTTADGDVRQGLLTPVTFDLKAAQAKMTPELTNPQQMVEFLDAGGQIVDRETGGDIVNVRKTHRYEVTTSKTGKGRKIAMEGGLYMASSGTRMRGNVLQQNAIDLIPFFEKVTGALKINLTTTPSTKDLVPGGASASFSRAPSATPITAQPLRTPAATIRAAITKAYGKLLGQLESKGLVTLTQTEDDAIEAAAQARAAKTGQSVEQARSTLRASVKNSVADQTQTEAFKRWFKGSKVVDADGKPLVVYHGTQGERTVFEPYWKQLEREAQPHELAGDGSIARIYRDAKAEPEMHFFAEDRGHAESYGEDVVEAYLSIDRMTGGPDADRGEAIREMLETGADGAQFYDTDANGGYGGTAYVVRKSAQVKSATGNNGNFDPANPDIRRSADGSIQGFFDPQTGQSFLIADNLTAEAAPGVLMHEVGIHMVADGSMKALFNRAAMMLKLQRGNPFMKAVQDRMDAAGETSGEEAAAYIAEAYENDRANAPASVQRWLADLLAAVKAWMFKKGIMGADRLTVADIAAVARANARSMARDGGATGGQGFGTAFSRAPAGDQTQTEAFKRWFGDSKAVDADGNPLVVYHGTHSSFTEFKPNDALGGGMFFSPSPEEAGAFTGATGSNIMPVYLSAQKVWPKIVRSYDEVKAIRAAKSKGYDAIRVRDDQNGVVNWVVFDPTQVKSAIGNNGDFDPTNPDIRFSRATEAAKAAGDAIKSVTVTNIKKRAGFKLTDYLGIGLQALGRRQIVDIYGDLVPLAEPLAEYNRLVQQMEADKNEGGAEADQLVTRWAELPDEGKLADLMHEATLAQIDPAKPYVDGDDKAKYAMLAGRFNALSQEAKQVYTDTRDAYQAHHAKVRSAIKERIERSELKGPRKAELLKQMDDEFFAAVKGVYFPLARFGQYAVTVKGPDGKVESVSRAETKAEAEALRNNLLAAFPRDKGFIVGRVMLSKDFIADRDAVGRGFMTELYQVLDKQDMDAAQRAELEDTLGQLYLSSLPDLSWAKHGIHRKGTPGFSQDARRAFAQNMFHGARYLAKLRYSDLMQDELTAMQKHVDDWREVEDFDQNSAQRVVDEMNKRHESLMNPKSNPLSTALTSFGFIFHLGLSPASAMVNLSQTALVAYPIMGAKWGFGKASAALLKASAEAAKGKNDITGSLNADERAAYDEAVRAGTIDVTMAHDLAGIAQGEDAGVMWKIRPVMRWASFLFHHAERFNRQVTFVAAYRLAREAGADNKAAFEQATKATYDGHFDYSTSNRARIMQGNVAKVLLLFKQYGQNMVYTLSRNAYQSIKGTDAEKAEARKVLAGLLTSHAMAAGVLGLPMVTTLLAAASMIGGDDDEPWDAKVALQNLLADTLGQKPAEVLAHGLSRLTPWDISGRVGLDRLIFPDVQEGLEGQRLAESAMTAALGPVAGIGVNLLKGAQMMGEGRFALGLEAMLPSALRGPVKALRYAEEGVQDKSGISILDEVSPAAVAGQALGFSPSAARNAQEGKSAVMAHDRALGERRQELLTRAARASMAKDAEALDDARKEIARFNEKNPGRRINPNHIMQSVRNRNKRIDQAQDGVYLPKSRRDAMQAGRFALAESE